MLSPATITNTIQITSIAPPPELNWADNQVIQSTAIALPRANKLLAGCAYDEYYDTPNNFRIYYTRTRSPWYLDCQLLPPTVPGVPPPAPDTPVPLYDNGYPYYVTLLGESLERSRLQYGSMNYPVNQTPVESGSNRYPVYVSSRPIWADVLIGGWSSDVRGTTLPDHMFIAHSLQYTTTKALDVDEVRTVGAHEYFHALQWTYVPNTCIGGIGGQYCTWTLSEELRWWMEASAAWAQPRVYNRDGQYPWQLESILHAPYRSLPASPVLGDNARAYGSFILATFLEQKIAEPRNPADGADAIIRKTWDQYKTNNGGSMVNAIDQVLRRTEYGTTLSDAFPDFTWNNYFLNEGTYTRDVGAYKYFTDYNPGHWFQGKEWQLFRSWLREGRENWQAGNAGVLVDRVPQYPCKGPVGYSRVVGNLGAGYIEFLPRNGGAPIPPGTALQVTLNIRSVVANLPAEARVSVLPISGNFGNLPHPANQFVQSIPVPGDPPTFRYSFQINNFDQCDRVTLVINNISTVDSFGYDYDASLLSPSPAGACSLQLP